MSESARLERVYRRLLAWYPETFRREQADEMLAVLMAGAERGQRRPHPADAVNVIWGALRMRLRSLWSGPVSQDWADGLALFSVAAPVLLLVTGILEVAMPYRPPHRSNLGPQLRGLVQIGGLDLFRVPLFDVTAAALAVIAVLALLGLRRLALIPLAAAVGYWIAVPMWASWIPGPLRVLFIGGLLLEAAALTAAPRADRPYHPVHWGHGVVVLLLAGALRVSGLMSDAARPLVLWLASRPDLTGYIALSAGLGAAAVGLALALRMNRHLLLLLAGVCYPAALQVAFPGSSTNLIGNPTPAHLTLLFLPPLLLACVTIAIAVLPRRSRGPVSSDRPSQA